MKKETSTFKVSWSTADVDFQTGIFKQTSLYMYLVAYMYI